MAWNTDTADLGAAIAEFEKTLPEFWWTVGQCDLGAHASCGVDANGEQAHLLKHLPTNPDGFMREDHPFDSGFHCDTVKGTPSEAIRDVMRQAVVFINNLKQDG